jgi:hypothetical protein
MRIAVTLTLSLALVACGTSGSAPRQAPDLTEEYGCGLGFYLGNVDQTAGLFVTFLDYDTGVSGDIPQSSSLSDDIWRAQLQFGADLFANWCDDVIEPGEPEPEVAETWDLSGTIQILELPAPGGCGPARALLTGVDAHSPDDDEVLALGDFDVENGFWGCFPG